MQNEMAACPFCGSSENLFTEPDERGSGGQWVPPVHAGCCAFKGCGVSRQGETEAEAIAAWNQRSPAALATRPTGESGEVERVARAIVHARQEEKSPGYGYALSDMPLGAGDLRDAQAAIAALRAGDGR